MSDAPHPSRLARLAEPVAVALYLTALAAVLVGLAAGRRFWFDELFTLHLARVGSVAGLWRELAAGVDLNPPLSYLLTRAAVGVFGTAEWAVRLPAVAGGLLTAGCVYLFVRRRRGQAEAWVGMTAVTLAHPVALFFQEARPYGLMCGWAALALVCWQRAAEPGAAARRWWAAGLAVALVLGVSTHYYFVLPTAGLAVGELARWVAARRIERAVAWCFVAVAVALLAYFPLWSEASRTYAPGFWAKAPLSRAGLEQSYGELLGPEAVPAVVAALGVAAVGATTARGRRPVGYLPWELAAMAGLAAVPAIGVVVGATASGGFCPRYAVAEVVGAAPLLAFTIGRTAGAARWPCYLAAAVFAALGLPGGWDRHAGRNAQAIADADAVTRFLDDRAAGGTVILGSPYEFVGQWRYAPDRHFRPVYVADPPAALRHGFTDTPDRGLMALTRLAPLPVRGLDEVLSDTSPGGLYYYGPEGWQYRELQDRGVGFDPVARHGGLALFRLTRR